MVHFVLIRTISCGFSRITVVLSRNLGNGMSMTLLLLRDSL